MRNSWIGFNSKFRLCNVGHVYVMTKYYWTLTGGRIFKWFRISWELSDLGEVGRLPFCKRGSRHPEHETSAPSCLPYRPTHYSTNFCFEDLSIVVQDNCGNTNTEEWSRPFFNFISPEKASFDRSVLYQISFLDVTRLLRKYHLFPRGSLFDFS